ncbi:MAG TPA: protein kinase [Gemmatimonadaceae bacterium]
MHTELQAALADRYRIDRELGQGGMATVHLARDVRHDRMVALKVMRPELLAVIGAQRFLAEIKTTASLQHPHILPLHDSGEVNGTVFYVMPFVEGESLRDRLVRERQLPVDDAVRLARQVAGALDYAHRRGVIHRDIKPENILLHEGQALIADFGIALAVSRLESGTRMTETGMSLGTPHYMSPEQAMGERSVDARADVYALGCVLYEMLAGEPPFTGPTAQAIVARVLTDTPRSLRAQRQTIPAHVEAAVHKALQKLPADRFGSAADFATALGDTAFGGDSTTRAPSGRSPGRRSRTGIVVAAVALVTLGALATATLMDRDDAPTTWTFLSHPRGEEGTFGFGSFAMAPDGKAYVYLGPGEGGQQLWMKRLGELHATPVRGTLRAFYPFFSPDGEWLAFFAGGKLMKMPASGGAPSAVTQAAETALWGTWLPNDRIVLGGSGYSLVEVEASGGSARPLDALPVTAFGAVAPLALPGTRGDFLFAACTVNCAARQMWVFDGSAGTSRKLLDDAYALGFIEDHVIYGVSGDLFAAPFDLERLELNGPGVPVLDNVLLASLSTTGTMLYTEGSLGGDSRLEWVTRDGRSTPVDTTWTGNFIHLAISPDGRRIAVDKTADDRQDIWIKDLREGTLSRVTFDGKVNMRPVWSPDNARLAWLSMMDSLPVFQVKRADGTGAVSTLIPHTNVWEGQWSPDGDWIAYRVFNGQNADDIYATRTSGDSTPVPIVTTPDHYERGISISPDGRYIAYTSSESGRDEVYVRPFPEAGETRWLVSAGGGTEPVWGPNGKELFYVSSDRVLQVVDVNLQGVFTRKPPRPMFSVNAFVRELNSRSYEVAPDGQRFLMIRGTPATAGAPVLVTNWVSELRRKLKK